MKAFIATLASVTIPVWAAFAQTTDSTTTPVPAPSAVTFSGYVEAYYTHDFTAPKTAQERPFFLYNHKRNREFNVNLAFLKAAYAGNRIRANLAVQVGTYAQYNYAAEQELARNIFEANAGVKLSRNHELWLDAGIFASHIGFESAISKDCWTLTRSILAENSPYYLAGAKLTYTSPNGKWVLLGSVLNGWQRIRKVQGYSGLSVSTQVQFKPSAAVTLNWSTFLGSDLPDSSKATRFFNNFYGIFQLGKVGLIAGFDVGSQRKSVGIDGRQPSGTFVWYSPVAILRYTAGSHVNLAGRVEYYNDKNGVILATGTPNGFQTWGYSLNVDYAITPQALWRVEGRVFDSKDAIFDGKRTNTSLTTSLALSF